MFFCKTAVFTRNIDQSEMQQHKTAAFLGRVLYMRMAQMRKSVFDELLAGKFTAS